MKSLRSIPLLTLAFALTLAASGAAQAQLAGSTVVASTFTEITDLAFGWSVKKSILNHPLFNERGEKIGIIEDIILALDKNVSYLIVGAGGFIGVGRYDVAIAASQVHDEGGRIVFSGATKESVKAMPRFDYASDAAMREMFISRAESNVAQAKTTIANLEIKAASANENVKVKMAQEVTDLKADLKTVEASIAEMKRSSASKWRTFENNMRAAMGRLRTAFEK
ncbi:MAG: PRC-barrel domain-containing protein [Cytophagales bacterium]|nr:PRC-barrel domain-containing protein [Cytophagales bacterium]